MARAYRHRLIDRRTSFRGEGGYTLVEVMVAMLLCSIMVTSIFSVALTVKTGGGKGESKIRASAGARQIAALLKNYVTAEAGTASTLAPDIPGPCAGAANNWSISCNGITDGCPGGGSTCYALALGTHTLTGVMGTLFEGPPWNARVQYYVSDAAGGSGIPGNRPVPAVSITTTWTDP